MFQSILMAAIGGAVGSACRLSISLLYAGISNKATLIVNVLGAFLLGMAASNVKPGWLYYLLAVGFCGGFTTFSTFSLEAMNLLKAGAFWQGAAYILASCLLCLGAVYLGHKIIIN